MRKLLLAGFLCTAISRAADFSGTWLGEVPFTFNGDFLRITQQLAIKLVQNGSTLTGKQYSDYDSAPVSEGKVIGDKVDFIVVAQEQVSNQISQVRLHFTGELKPDGTIEITRVRETATNATNSGAYQYRGANVKQTFTLKRIPESPSETRR
jgi:hypothetical protein